MLLSGVTATALIEDRREGGEPLNLQQGTMLTREKFLASGVKGIRVGAMLIAACILTGICKTGCCRNFMWLWSDLSGTPTPKIQFIELKPWE